MRLALRKISVLFGKKNRIPAPYTIVPGQVVSLLEKAAVKHKKDEKYRNGVKKSTVSKQKQQKIKEELDQPKQREYVQKTSQQKS